MLLVKGVDENSLAGLEIGQLLFQPLNSKVIMLDERLDYRKDLLLADEFSRGKCILSWSG